MKKSLKWLGDRISALGEVLYSPEKGFSREMEGPSYLIPLCVFGAGFVLLAILQAPLMFQWAQQQLQAKGGTPDQIEAALALLSSSQRWGAAIVPLLLFVKWLLFAAAIWLTSQLLLADLRFTRVLSVVGYSYAPILVRDAAILLILYLQGERAFRQPEAMTAAIGLNLLLPDLRLPWSMLAGNINLFELWYVTLLTIGISKLAASRWSRALTVTLANWLFVLLLQFGFLSLSLSVRGSMGR